MASVVVAGWGQVRGPAAGGAPATGAAAVGASRYACTPFPGSDAGRSTVAEVDEEDHI